MQDIWHALEAGFPFSFINVIGILGFSLAIIIERTIYIFSKYRVNASAFMAQIRKLVQAGNIDRAVKLCEAEPLPLLQVMRSGLTQTKNGEEAIMAKMEESMGEVLPNLDKRIPWLWTLANLATLIGLIGTIKGLIVAFDAVAKIPDPGKKTEALSAGIAEAMWNTFFGLLIAVICMAAHLFLNSMAQKKKHELEKAANKLENLLTLNR